MEAVPAKHYHVHQSLQDFVLGMTAIDADLPPGVGSAVTPYPPTPLQSIIFYFDHPIGMQKLGQAAFEKQSPIVVIGPQYTRVNIMVTRKLRAIRVDFKPGGLHRLLRLPMTELFDLGVAADALLGNAAIVLHEKLLHAATMDEAVRLVENFLVTEMFLQPRSPFDYAVDRLMLADGSVSVETTASLACMSVRQFERLCLERIGMTPKSFSRIIRFSKAYRLRESNPCMNWTSIAAEAGYFDQMHLIRDFRQFAGTTPTIIDSDLRVTPLRMQAGIL